MAVVGGYNTAYPELPFTDPAPAPDFISFADSVKTLMKITNESIARAVFAVMFAEAKKDKPPTGFISAGGFNFAGVQTDNARWSDSQYIIGQYSKIDIGGNRRSFAIFKNAEQFFKFMCSRIAAKGFDGLNGNAWVTTYIQKWWSPENKNEYTQGTEKFNQKLAIYNAAMKVFDQFKPGPEKKLKLFFFVLFALVVVLVIFLLFKNVSLLIKILSSIILLGILFAIYKQTE